MSNIVTIIIPAFNQSQYTKQCLEKLFANTDPDCFELIVVDNNSTDETPGLLLSFGNKVTVITNSVNMGFATACNQGARAASGRYLLFLNNDTEVQPGWLKPLVETLEIDSSIAAVGSKLLYPDGKLQHAGVVIIEQKNVCSLLPRHVFMGEDPAQCPVDQPMCFQALTAACLLVNKDEFIARGGFDEAYWNGCEDVDFCFRLQQNRKKLVYQPKSVVIHHESKSGKERQLAQPRNNARLRTKWDKVILPDIIQEGSISRRGPSRAVMPLSTDHLNSIEFLESAVSWWTKKTKKRWRAGNAIIRFIERLLFARKVLPATDHMKEIFRRIEMRQLRESNLFQANLKAHADEATAVLSVAISPVFVKTDIVICVHDAMDDLKRCLNSVIQTMPEFCKLILVNDGSDDETTAFMRQFAHMHSMQCILLENKSALGYTRSANQGLRASTAEHVILLNSDTIVSRQWVERLTECAVSDPTIGIVGPLSNAASWQTIPNRFGPDGDWAVNELPEGYTVDKMAELVYHLSHKRFPPVVFVNGFCFLVKRSVIKSIGLLDELSFPDGYGEENDYCLRAAKAGFGLAIADHGYVYHAKSKSYSHDRRIELSRKSSKTLAKIHGARLIKQGVEYLRHQTDLSELRLKIRNHLKDGNTSITPSTASSIWAGSMVNEKDTNTI